MKLVLQLQLSAICLLLFLVQSTTACRWPGPQSTAPASSPVPAPANTNPPIVIDTKCRLLDVYVSGTWVDTYLDDVPNEEECRKRCKQLVNCTAVNYWPKYKECLPQIENLADPSQRDKLQSRVEPGAVYIVVRGCGGENAKLEKPKNILAEEEVDLIDDILDLEAPRMHDLSGDDGDDFGEDLVDTIGNVPMLPSDANRYDL